MKMLKIKTKVVSLILVTLTATLTQTAMAKSIDDKQDTQKDRITQGIKSGELTANEAWRLGNKQRSIYKKERRFKADGTFTRRERAVIHRDLLKSSGSIYKQKHDRQIQKSGQLGTKSRFINKRQNKQGKRIAQGVRSGALTRKETARLGMQQARIQQKKRHFKADGSFTKGERLSVRKSQNRASKNIYRKKHNGKHR